MSYKSLISKLGYTIDPFSKTNADEEEIIDRYFIEPPFFKAVYGDITSPQSSVVFAPRGGGKTALKRMIEIKSQSESLMCVTYNNFNVSSRTLKDITLEYHLQNIVKLILISIIASAREIGKDTLTKEDRHLLYLFVNEYFSEINKSELKIAINSVKSLSDTAKEFWNNFTGPISLVLNTLLINMGLTPAEIRKFASSNGDLGDLTDQLRVLREMSLKLEYSSIYVLIDKVDENNLTNNRASYTYDFIESLITNLQILELDGYAFKLFLWEDILEEYRKAARPDRQKYYVLEWDLGQLVLMLSRRIAAYNEIGMTSFAEICIPEEIIDIDKKIVLFSQGSPRNIIRICKEIIDQQSEIEDDTDKISIEAINKGFDIFTENYASETYNDSMIKDLIKIKRLSFTSPYLYNDVFKISQQAGSSKIKVLVDNGLIKLLGTTPTGKNNNFINLYGISSIIIAKRIFSELSLSDFLNSKVYECPRCGCVMIRDWDIQKEHVCHECQEAIRKM